MSNETNVPFQDWEYIQAFCYSVQNSKLQQRKSVPKREKQPPQEIDKKTNKKYVIKNQFKKNEKGTKQDKPEWKVKTGE